MADIYKHREKAYISGFPDNCPRCNEKKVKWQYVNQEMSSSPKQVYHSGSTKSEYSFGKGLLGTAIFGPVGAVAGINGKEKRSSGYFTKEGEYTYRISAQCPECGYLHEVMTQNKLRFERDYEELSGEKLLDLEPGLKEQIEDLVKNTTVIDDIIKILIDYAQQDKMEFARRERGASIWEDHIYKRLEEKNFYQITSLRFWVAVTVVVTKSIHLYQRLSKRA